jgi:hypothetical protein
MHMTFLFGVEGVWIHDALRLDMATPLANVDEAI